MKSLFKKVGFVDEYYRDTVNFFSPFMDEGDMFRFFERVFCNDEKDKTPRRMMNQVVRWVSLAEDMQKIRPGRDPLTIMCIRACIESICSYGGAKADKIGFFEKNMSKDSLEYICRNFSITLIENEKSGEELIDYKSLIQRFDQMIFAIRNEAVHDGDYWDSQVFSLKDGLFFSSRYRWENKKEKRWERVWYETKIDYNTFIKIFVETAIGYIEKHIYNKCGQSIGI